MRYKFATSTTLSDNGKESLAICQLCKLLGELIRHFILTLPVQCISESCIEITINLNF